MTDVSGKPGSTNEPIKAEIKSEKQKSLDRKLIEAAKYGDLVTLKSLLLEGADSNTDLSGGALISAIDNKNLDVAFYLLSHYPNLTKKYDSFGETALDRAIRKDLTELATKILELAPSIINSKNTHGQIALHFAKSSGAVKLLISKGSFLDEKDIFGKTPLYMACNNMAISVAKTLIDSGSIIDQELYKAAKNNLFDDQNINNLIIKRRIIGSETNKSKPTPKSVSTLLSSNSKTLGILNVSLITATYIAVTFEASPMLTLFLAILSLLGISYMMYLTMHTNA